MPMQWLAGNTHFLGQCGIVLSLRSMGKAIDALETAMIATEEDGSKNLDEISRTISFLETILTQVEMRFLCNHW